MSKRKPIVQDGVIAGNVYDKYHSRNPVARWLMNGFIRSVHALVARSGASDINEVGCGEGSLAHSLALPGRRVRATDFSDQVISLARDAAREAGVEIAFKVSDIYALTPDDDSAELVVCCEVLEHLEDPQRALRVLARLAKPYLLVSVPREPLWRILNLAAGRYVSDLGNTPGHVQHWSKRAFVEMLQNFVDIVEVRRPLPWTVVLCRARD